MPAYDKPRVAISYTHDLEGRKIAAAIVVILEDAGFEVMWDEKFPPMNPPSLLELIDDCMTDYPVIVVCSPVYVKRIINDEDESFEHPTALYEWRLLKNRYKNHTRRSGCPIIPVASSRYPAKDFLSSLMITNMIVTKLDLATRAGAKEILDRVRGIHIGSESQSDVDTPLCGPRPSGALDQAMLDIETTPPTALNAIDAVLRWLKLAQEPSEHPTRFVQSFPTAERIIKARGDVDTMVSVVDTCLKALDDNVCFEVERTLKAQILIRGRSWHLRRQHRLEEALHAAKRGVKLAQDCRAEKEVALGKRCLARIYRCLAEDAAGDERRGHLREAARLVEEALHLFEAIERHGGEVAVCRMVRANIHFTAYRLLRRPSELWNACRQANKAAGRLPSDRAREHNELLILRARIAAAQGCSSRAKTLIAKAITRLSELAVHGASYAELLGRAHLLSAELLGAVDEVDQARSLFTELGQVRAIGSCDWARLKLGRKTRKLTRRDVVLLERMCADPAERLLAVEEHERWKEERTGARWYRRRAYWRDVVGCVRARPG